MRKDAWLVSPPKPTVPINGGLGVVTKESMHTGQMTFTRTKWGTDTPSLPSYNCFKTPECPLFPLEFPLKFSCALVRRDTSCQGDKKGKYIKQER
ncbi:hypothetical protein RCL_jg23302.t1 [Rhizophagus clarus]|uniref:Uncharacterized protein n=1 Tax=Rhizophagus clarus TaxID=94130 RepID=A0A8H3QH64_9GLOM|nr:hypothetical protein RCL_jg23302.t1 [Rhizophagus clarus]